MAARVMERFSAVLRQQLVIALSAPGALMAQKAGAIIRVLDQHGAPVPHAFVEVRGAPGRVADDSGRVSLIATDDSLSVTVRRIGHQPFFGRIGVAAGRVTTVTIPSLAQTLAPVTVTEARTLSPLERAGFYDRVQRVQRGAFSAEFITPEELDARQGWRPSDLFQGRRFVKVARTSGMSPQSYLMGRGGCQMTVYVDGHLFREEWQRGAEAMMNSRGGGGSRERMIKMVPLDDIVSPNEIAAIEIYASAANAPAEMIPLVGAAKDGACGIVAIWTGGRR